MHLPCGGIYNNHIIADCLQCVPVKKFGKSVNNWRRYRQSKVAHFYGPRCIKQFIPLAPAYGQSGHGSHCCEFSAGNSRQMEQ